MDIELSGEDSRLSRPEAQNINRVSIPVAPSNVPGELETVTRTDDVETVAASANAAIPEGSVEHDTVVGSAATGGGLRSGLVANTGIRSDGSTDAGTGLTTNRLDGTAVASVGAVSDSARDAIPEGSVEHDTAVGSAATGRARGVGLEDRPEHDAAAEAVAVGGRLRSGLVANTEVRDGDGSGSATGLTTTRLDDTAVASAEGAAERPNAAIPEGSAEHDKAVGGAAAGGGPAEHMHLSFPGSTVSAEVRGGDGSGSATGLTTNSLDGTAVASDGAMAASANAAIPEGSAEHDAAAEVDTVGTEFGSELATKDDSEAGRLISLKDAVVDRSSRTAAERARGTILEVSPELDVDAEAGAAERARILHPEVRGDGGAAASAGAATAEGKTTSHSASEYADKHKELLLQYLTSDKRGIEAYLADLHCGIPEWGQYESTSLSPRALSRELIYPFDVEGLINNALSLEGMDKDLIIGKTHLIYELLKQKTIEGSPSNIHSQIDPDKLETLHLLTDNIIDEFDEKLSKYNEIIEFAKDTEDKELQKHLENAIQKHEEVRELLNQYKQKIELAKSDPSIKDFNDLNYQILKSGIFIANYHLEDRFSDDRSTIIIPRIAIKASEFKDYSGKPTFNVPSPIENFVLSCAKLIAQQSVSKIALLDIFVRQDTFKILNKIDKGFIGPTIASSGPEDTPQTHTVIIWEYSLGQFILIDPNLFEFSSFLYEGDDEVQTLKRCLDDDFSEGGRYSGITAFYQKGGVHIDTGRKKPSEARDCVDIALKIASEIYKLSKLDKSDDGDAELDDELPKILIENLFRNMSTEYPVNPLIKSL